MQVQHFHLKKSARKDSINVLWHTQTFCLCNCKGCVVWLVCQKTHKRSKHLDLCNSYLVFLFHVQQFNRRKKCLRWLFISNPDYWSPTSLMKSRKSIADWCFPCAKSDFCILLIPSYNLCPALCDPPCNQNPSSPDVTRDINIKSRHWKPSID